jgi:Domain of unknown function (DUF1996)
VISSPDLRRHASYMSDDNVCPNEFPYHMPMLNLEVRYDLEAMREVLGRDVVNNIDNWNLSTMAKSGARTHADCVSGECNVSCLVYCVFCLHCADRMARRPYDECHTIFVA